MNHDDIHHSHDILIIKPSKSVEAVNRKLEALLNRGLANRDYFNKWSITDKGMEYVENYFHKGEI